MSISGFFERLGAPLTNARWSWGAQRPTDGAVFLRVWQDRKFIEGGRLHMMIDHKPTGSEKANPGYTERQRHIDLIRSGPPCFLIMCSAVNPDEHPRKIEFFNEDDIFVGGEVVEKDEATWIQVTGRHSMDSVVPLRGQ